MILFFAVIGYLSSTFLLPPPTTYCILLTIRQLHPHSRVIDLLIVTSPAPDLFNLRDPDKKAQKYTFLA
jgi:hypothetical protein